ncbi:hypothetical protein ACFOUP_07965 [Belliella kenyensis]|uniref:Uncharacterized protein n=1 Tax=Belliella kenyensis TaxID=1472724 RepID=A0ABV8ELT6_9BACT|nr:hypothetical protein [Belliella kenyensis]MCH7400409.1 hypothetical protein [Belliella kenyensis]MDN3604574.1 hypothetical protein [Belliella kenyensis]
MKIPSLVQIKKELSYLNDQELTNLIIDLSKFSRDNKSYLFFKLFERDNPRLFVEMVQEELELDFSKSNSNNFHAAKKAAQALRRKLNKHLKLKNDTTVQIELIVFFCKNLKAYGYLRHGHPVIQNLYDAQLRKIQNLISKLHEDLQYDYEAVLEELM